MNAPTLIPLTREEAQITSAALWFKMFGEVTKPQAHKRTK